MIRQHLLILCACVSICACKIEVVTQNGTVNTESGTYSCANGDTCVIDVADAFFNETFQADPASGYQFVAWRTKALGLCGGKDTPCGFNTALFAEPPLSQFLDSEVTFSLEPVFGKPDTWESRPDLPLVGDAISSCVIRGKIYAIGVGYSSEDPSRSRRTEEYDPVTNSWTRMADMPTTRAWATASVVNDKCYVFGGFPGLQTTAEEYDPKADSWRSLSPLELGRTVPSSAAVNGKIYVIGGGGEGFSWTRAGIASVEIYDPATDQWSHGADLPNPRGASAIGVIDGYIYVVGGSDFSEVGTDLVHRYDPATDSWTQRASLPIKVVNATAAVVDGALYVIGGFDDQNTAESRAAVHRYNSMMNSWTRVADLQQRRHSLSSAVVDGQIYVMGGREFRAQGALNVMEVYTP